MIKKTHHISMVGGRPLLEEVKCFTIKPPLAVLSSKHSKERGKSVPPPSKVEGGTSKICPHCLRETGENVTRSRFHEVVGPLRREHCEEGLPVYKPKVDYSKFPWTLPGISWLFAPSDYGSNTDWYERRVYATCKIHGRVLVTELCGIRKFSRFRRLLIWIRFRIMHTLDWIIPLN